MKVAKAHVDLRGDTYRQTDARGLVILEPAEVKLVDWQRDSIKPRVVLRGPVKVDQVRDVLSIGPIGSRNDFLTVTFRDGITITTGCMTGSIEDFERELWEKDGVNRKEYEAAVTFIRQLAKYRGK
jgi:hypothetical protein